MCSILQFICLINAAAIINGHYIRNNGSYDSGVIYTNMHQESSKVVSLLKGHDLNDMQALSKLSNDKSFISVSEFIYQMSEHAKTDLMNKCTLGLRAQLSATNGASIPDIIITPYYITDVYYALSIISFGKKDFTKAARYLDFIELYARRVESERMVQSKYASLLIERQGIELAICLLSKKSDQGFQNKLLDVILRSKPVTLEACIDEEALFWTSYVIVKSRNELINLVRTHPSQSISPGHPLIGINRFSKTTLNESILWAAKYLKTEIEKKTVYSSKDLRLHFNKGIKFKMENELVPAVSKLLSLSMSDADRDKLIESLFDNDAKVDAAFATALQSIPSLGQHSDISLMYYQVPLAIFSSLPSVNQLDLDVAEYKNLLFLAREVIRNNYDIKSVKYDRERNTVMEANTCVQIASRRYASMKSIIIQK